jgi:protocatechuate 3,4-dioxygenase, alpha subunit
MTDRAGPGRPGAITPSQTVGPFFAYALTPAGKYALADLVGTDLVTEDAAGARIAIAGRVLDGDGAPVADAMVEIWQADGEGRYAGADAALSNSSFRGFGRAGTDEEGRYAFTTVKPGRVAGLNGAMQAPHINVGVFARGVLRRLFTRLYFADEAEANAADPILKLVPEDARRTLIAERNGEAAYAFDIRLQGLDETVFFEA